MNIVKMNAARAYEIQLVEAANRGDLKDVQQALSNNPLWIGGQYWRASIMAAEDFPEVVDCLFEQLATTTLCSDVIFSLINTCAPETFKRALPYFSELQVADMFNSSIYEQSSVLYKWMLNHVQFPFNGYMLISCIENENLDLLNKIISQVDARFENSWALRCAADNRWQEGVDALWCVSNPAEALAFMKNQSYMTSDDYKMIEQRLTAEQQKEAIVKELNSMVAHSVKRKM
jgi:hypothetical protein